MLCAVSVRAGSEAAMARRIMRAAEGAALDAYALRRELLRREEGAWRLRQDVLFPGYVIVETCDPELLGKRLEVLSAFSHLVYGAGGAVGTLTKREAALVRMLGGRDHLVGVSVGEIVSNRLNVTSGPLVGLERLVAKIDRHKRIAYLDAAAFASFAAGEPRRPGRRGGVAAARAEASRPVRVALEVVRKE